VTKGFERRAASRSRASSLVARGSSLAIRRANAQTPKIVLTK
jgi:hypothetical protein